VNRVRPPFVPFWEGRGRAGRPDGRRAPPETAQGVRCVGMHTSVDAQHHFHEIIHEWRLPESRRSRRPAGILRGRAHRCGLSCRPSDQDAGHLARSGIRPLEGTGRHGRDVGERFAGVPIAGDAACTARAGNSPDHHARTGWSHGRQAPASNGTSKGSRTGWPWVVAAPGLPQTRTGSP
jgi:hypothetical protein